jgi:uncharacterized damage-inducible protein DinB
VDYNFNREWLIKKFEEIRRRILKAVDQLDDEQLNWQPDQSSHSISMLINHMEGNIEERVVKGILREDSDRSRENEFKPTYVKKAELQTIIQDRLQLVIDTIQTITDETLEQTQMVRNRERTNLDMLHQCAAHYSEHM